MTARSIVLRLLPGLVAIAGSTLLGASRGEASAAGAPASIRPLCNIVSPDAARCFAVIDVAGSAAARNRSGGQPSGYGATDLESAYRLPLAGGAGQTIAVVDAYDDPTAAHDLNVYRRTYGLPPCTIAGGCFRRINQAGHTGPYPPYDPGWSIEMSLDLDMVSAACPRCHIVLVEANSNLLQDLATSEDTAAGLGVAAISNSYGIQEFNGMKPLAQAYRHSGTTIVAASGDSGFGPPNFPAVLSNVIAVGGTTLTPDGSSRGWSEAAWPFGSSGCSAYISKPSWQTDRHCFMRTVADVSAVADSIAVYDSNIPPGFFGLEPGFVVVGGTSASSPFVAGVVGLAGNGQMITTAFPYGHRGGFFDVIGGSNGYCGGDYLCDAVRGYDGPTGVGSPDGIAGL
jgi:subtilase family serine protease